MLRLTIVAEIFCLVDDALLLHLLGVSNAWSHHTQETSQNFSSWVRVFSLPFSKEIQQECLLTSRTEIRLCPQC